jgi:hypothetical protein
MGTYINLGNEGFKSILNSEYVDKSELIRVINSNLNSESRYSCVTRCRRFGKSMAAKMLCAYYDKSCDSRELFANLEIAKDPSFEQHLNKYPVIFLDMTSFTTRDLKKEEIIPTIQREVKEELLSVYPNIVDHPKDDLMATLIKIQQSYHEKFIMIIDEWDAICREFLRDEASMTKYTNLLRRLFKGLLSDMVFAGVYMTGILPIKKYDTQSALNNFRQYTMIQPFGIARYFGFTKEEVRKLCEKHGMDFDEMVKWYDGYQIGNEPSMFNPNSVMEALAAGECDSFWATTGSFDMVSDYIKMNYQGLKDDIIKLIAGGRAKVNASKFSNDMAEVKSRDDVLTVLIHLGYLAYDKKKSEVYIPNKEVEMEMTNAVENTDWNNIIDMIHNSEQLVEATLMCDTNAVVQAIDKAHDEHTSILSYNDENSLSCVISLAYYYAKNDYIFFRELPTGKGFADIVMLPRKNVNLPALVVELKYDKDSDTAINQIHRKEYPSKVAEYTGNLLLVGINYDRTTKTHTCQIEHWQK